MPRASGCGTSAFSGARGDSTMVCCLARCTTETDNLLLGYQPGVGGL
ncbi:MAG TPA: hypothetical protein VGK67_30740 [Myxococcales bacterium]